MLVRARIKKWLPAFWPAAGGLCRPSSSSPPVVILAKAARPRRLLALRVAALICGVLVRLNCVPSRATSRQDRQKASGCVAAWASGRNPSRISSAKTSQGSRVRRSLNERSAKDSSESWTKCWAKVPAALMTWKTKAGSTRASATRGRRPRRLGKRGKTEPKHS